MKTIHEYLHHLYSINYPILFDAGTVEEIEENVNTYILSTFNKIKQKKYFFLELSDDKCYCHAYMDSELDDEFLKYYPERLI